MTMTTHGPLSRFNVIRESIAVRLRQRPCRKISVVAASDVVTDVNEPSNKDAENVGFCGEPFANKGELLSSLSPLLFSMKLFGLYFEREDQHRRRTGDPDWNQTASTTRPRSNWLRVYATFFVIFMWLEIVRFASVFNQSDHFGAILLMKITVFNWFALLAIFQSSYYFACHTRKLSKVLQTLPVTRGCITGARRTAVFLTALVWITLLANLSVGTYFYFATEGAFDFILTPFVTHINIPEDNVKIVRVIASFSYVLLFPGVFLSHSMNQVLVYIFYNQFKKLKKVLRRELGEQGQFSGDLSLYRRRHQTLSKAVSKVDGFVKFGNVAGFVCHIANIILVLYSFIFYQESRKNARTALTYFFWLVANADGLLFSASAGIIVNHMVRIVRV